MENRLKTLNIWTSRSSKFNANLVTHLKSDSTLAKHLCQNFILFYILSLIRPRNNDNCMLNVQMPKRKVQVLSVCKVIYQINFQFLALAGQNIKFQVVFKNRTPYYFFCKPKLRQKKSYLKNQKLIWQTPCCVKMNIDIYVKCNMFYSFLCKRDFSQCLGQF